MSNNGLMRGFAYRQYNNTTEDDYGIIKLKANSDIKKGDLVVNNILKDATTGYIQSAPYINYIHTIPAYQQVLYTYTAPTDVNASVGSVIYTNNKKNFFVSYSYSTNGTRFYKFNDGTPDGTTTGITAVTTLAAFTVSKLENDNIVQMYTSATYPKFTIQDTTSLTMVTTNTALEVVASNLTYSIPLKNGNFVALYRQTSNLTIRGGIFSPTGTLLTSYTSFIDTSNTLIGGASFSDSSFVIAYRDSTGTGYPKFKIFDSTGGLVLGETTIENTAATNKIAVSVLSDDRFIVMYYASSYSANTYSIISKAGVILDGPVRFSSLTSSYSLAYCVINDKQMVFAGTSSVNNYYTLVYFNLETKKSITTQYVAASGTSANVSMTLDEHNDVLLWVQGGTLLLKHSLNNYILLGVAENDANANNDVNIRYNTSDGKQVRCKLNYNYSTTPISFDHRQYLGTYGIIQNGYATIKGY